MTLPLLRGLILDWGGVLTSGMRESFVAWAEEDGIDLEPFIATMRRWLSDYDSTETILNPIHALERGQMEVPDFEAHVAAELSERSGKPVPADGLLERIVSHFQHAPEMNALVRRAREQGIATALLSNSWGNRYPRHLWEGMFDAVVISGEVGMRKPDPDIYLHALSLLDLPASQCVFVDDIDVNVRGAAAVGMVGVHHVSYATTARELETLFGLPLA